MPREFSQFTVDDSKASIVKQLIMIQLQGSNLFIIIHLTYYGAIQLIISSTLNLKLILYESEVRNLAFKIM